MKNLTTSNVERQNILNNRFAVEEIQNRLDIAGLLFEGEYRFTKKMVADFYDVDERTIDRYLERHKEELLENGYFLCRGKSLKNFKLQFGHDINVVTKTSVLGLFDFRSFLNLGMLLQESEKAKQVRSLILDIVIETINQRTGGGTKYINRRDINYLSAAITEENYRQNLTSAINNFVDGHQTYKYAQITDFIYKAVFRENAKEYREILQLKKRDSMRNTLYAEVLLVISSFENGVASEIRRFFNENGGKKLTVEEVESIVHELAEHPLQKPYIGDARSKMASRDLSFRDAFHGNIAEYLKAVTPEEYERFIGSLSVDFDKILADNADVLERLK